MNSSSRIDVVEWAHSVDVDEPPGLRDVEDVLLRNHPENLERLELTPAPAWYSVAVLAYASAPFLPLFGPITFMGGWWRGQDWGASSINDGLPWVGLGFWFAAAFFAHQLVSWWTHRYRSGTLVGFALFDGALGGLTLYLVYGQLDRFYGNAILHLFPIWATTALAAVAAVVFAVSPKGPNRLGIKHLVEESRALLIEERGAALRVLAERGLLSEDPDVLGNRPLGELHRPV